MKTNNALPCILFLLLLRPRLHRAEFILDSDGNRLNNGGTYYIDGDGETYAGISIKGAVINESTSDESCSLAVVAGGSDENGWATKITTPYPLSYITNDYPLNISFAILPSNPCTNTSSWIVADVNGFVAGEPVMVGGFEEFAVAQSGYFYIKPYESTEFYKFAFCNATATCGYVTVTADGYTTNYRLSVTQDRSVQPLVFKFVKETSYDVVSGISMAV